MNANIPDDIDHFVSGIISNICICANDNKFHDMSLTYKYSIERKYLHIGKNLIILMRCDTMRFDLKFKDSSHRIESWHPWYGMKLRVLSVDPIFRHNFQWKAWDYIDDMHIANANQNEYYTKTVAIKSS